jgi:hypothetical protein
MILLKCEGGVLKNGDACTYRVTYSDRSEADVLASAKKMGGYHCPTCRKFSLRIMRAKT